jgi:AraC-like DNA-binding protein
MPLKRLGAVWAVGDAATQLRASGSTYRDIATILGLSSPEAARSLVRRAKKWTPESKASYRRRLLGQGTRPDAERMPG